jgi:hypothetical protein
MRTRRVNEMEDLSEKVIQQALAVLEGAPMWGSGRAVNMQMFQFGQRQPAIDRHGAEYFRGEYALHVQCAWHIVQRERLVVGSGDLYRPFNGDLVGLDDFDWEVPGSNRRDVVLKQLFDQASLTVRASRLERTGRMFVAFDGDFELAVFPDRTDEGVEFWRFLKPGSDEPHLVFTAGGPEFQ